MITSDLNKMGLFQFKEFEKYLPVIDTSTNIDDDVIGARMFISEGAMELYNHPAQYEGYIAHCWQKLYLDVVTLLMRKTIGRNDYFVTRFVPKMMPDKGFGIVLELLVDCFVAPTRNVYIPEIVYERVGEWSRAREWRCGYCKSPNEMKERHCTQCGAARALLLQEM